MKIFYQSFILFGGSLFLLIDRVTCDFFSDWLTPLRVWSRRDNDFLLSPILSCSSSSSSSSSSSLQIRPFICSPMMYSLVQICLVWAPARSRRCKDPTPLPCQFDQRVVGDREPPRCGISNGNAISQLQAGAGEWGWGLEKLEFSVNWMLLE